MLGDRARVLLGSRVRSGGALRNLVSLGSEQSVFTELHLCLEGSGSWACGRGNCLESRQSDKAPHGGIDSVETFAVSAGGAGFGMPARNVSRTRERVAARVSTVSSAFGGSRC